MELDMSELYYYFIRQYSRHCFYLYFKKENIRAQCIYTESHSWLARFKPVSKAYAHDYHLQGLPGSSDSEESTCSAGDLGSNPGLVRFPGKGNGYPL